MNTKQLLYLGLAIVVLAVIYFAVQSGSVPKAEISMLVEIDTANVSEVSIYKDGTTTTLTRGEKGWNITNPYEFPANNSFIKTMLKKIDDLRIETKVTSNKERWPEFELNEAKGTKVTVIQDGNRSDFIIGKASSGYKQTYARLEGSEGDDVYLIRGSYGVAINRAPGSWREKKIADFTEEEIIKYTTDELEMVKEGEDWRITPKEGESFLAEQVKAKKITRNLKNLRTSDFPDEEDYKDVDWDKPYKECLIELSTGDSRKLSFYHDKSEDKDNRYFLKYHDRPTVFRVYKGMVSQLFKEPEELRMDPEDKNIVR
jgi:hypothetical protein